MKKLKIYSNKSFAIRDTIPQQNLIPKSKSYLMKYILLFIFLIISLSNVYGQSITWQRMYDSGSIDDNGRDISEDGKGNFYICGSKFGYFYLMKINEYGVKLWDIYISQVLNNALSIVSSGDGGCVVTGSNDSTYAIKFDSLGNVIWWKNYSYGSYTAYDIDKTSDGGYIICGEVINTYRDGMAFRVDSLGNLKWFRTYPAAFSTRLFNIIESDEGQFLATGLFFTNQIDQYLYIIGLDANGILLWDKKYKIREHGGIGRKIIKFSSNYILSGQIGSPSQWFPFFAGVNNAGDTLFIRTFPMDTNAYNPKIVMINNNKFLLSYSIDSRPTFISNGKLLITDLSGNILNQKILPSGGYMYLENTILLNNGDILSVGSNEFDTTNNRDIYAVRTDSLLNTQPIGIKNGSFTIPNNIELMNIYPNPFNPETNIEFKINQRTDVEVSIYDITGKHLEVLLNNILNPGTYKIKWFPFNLASGIYFCIIKINRNVNSAQKIIFIK